MQTEKRDLALRTNETEATTAEENDAVSMPERGMNTERFLELNFDVSIEKGDTERSILSDYSNFEIIPDNVSPSLYESKRHIQAGKFVDTETRSALTKYVSTIDVVSTPGFIDTTDEEDEIILDPQMFALAEEEEDSAFREEARRNTARNRDAIEFEEVELTERAETRMVTIRGGDSDKFDPEQTIRDKSQQNTKDLSGAMIPGIPASSSNFSVNTTQKFNEMADQLQHTDDERIMEDVAPYETYEETEAEKLRRRTPTVRRGTKIFKSNKEEGKELDCFEKAAELYTEGKSQIEDFANADTSDELCAVGVLFFCHLTVVLMMFIGYLQSAGEVRNHQRRIVDLLLSYFIMYGSLLLFGCCSYTRSRRSQYCSLLSILTMIGIFISTIFLFVDFFDMTEKQKNFLNQSQFNYFFSMYKAFIYSHIGVLCLAIFGSGCIVGWVQRSPLFDATRASWHRHKDHYFEFRKRDRLMTPFGGLLLLVHLVICIIMFQTYVQEGCKNNCNCSSCPVLLDTYFFHFFASPFFLFLCTPFCGFGKPDFRHNSFSTTFGLSFLFVTIYFIFEFFEISDECKAIIEEKGSKKFFRRMSLFAIWNVVLITLSFCSIAIFILYANWKQLPHFETDDSQPVSIRGMFYLRANNSEEEN